MTKICNDCVNMYKGCWEDGNNFCYRDNEELLPKKKDVGIVKDKKNKR